MSFSHSRLMFPCEEVNVAMRDPVVKSEHQPHLQATELRTNTEGKIPVAKQGRRAGKYRGHLDVSSLEGQAGSEEPITAWETSTKILYLMELSQEKCSQVYRDCQPMERSKKATRISQK